MLSVLFPLACPDIITKDITAGHEFIVIACDGIWDVMSNEEVLQFVRTRIAQRTEPSTVCAKIFLFRLYYFSSYLYYVYEVLLNIISS